VASGSTASSCQVTSVANQVVPSVVTIAATGPNRSGTGSGEVIRLDGYIRTSNHVISVAAGGGSVHVLFPDGKTETATITGRDPLTDLAMLKIQPAAGNVTLGAKP
jgi:putative serine protease PepD